MNHFKKTITAGMMLFSCLSCSKKDTKTGQSPDPVLSKEDANRKMIVGTWAYVSATSATPYDWHKTGQPTTDFWKPCMKDNTVTFTSDGKMIIYENADRCSENDQTINTWWSIRNVTTLAFGTEALDIDAFGIDEITETTMKFHRGEYMGPMKPSIGITYIYQRK